MFGMSDFGSSKQQDHTKDAEEATYKQFLQKREHRQFMNKRAGTGAPTGMMQRGPMQIQNDN